MLRGRPSFSSSPCTPRPFRRTTASATRSPHQVWLVFLPQSRRWPLSGRGVAHARGQSQRRAQRAPSRVPSAIAVCRHHGAVARAAARTAGGSPPVARGSRQWEGRR